MTRRAFIASLTAALIVQPQRPFASSSFGRLGKWFGAPKLKPIHIRALHGEYIILTGAELERWKMDVKLDETHVHQNSDLHHALRKCGRLVFSI